MALLPLATLALLARPLQAARVTAVLDTQDCDLSKYPGLYSRFKNLKTAGSGANGCVLLANDKQRGGIQVAVKVVKRASTKAKFNDWQDECKRSRRLVEKACTAGEAAHALVERYLPVCLEVGGTFDAPFLVMHAAGGKGLGDSAKGLAEAARPGVFAQMVEAVGLLHGLGASHNDLHNQNVIVLDGKPGTYLAVIDFGEVRKLSAGHRGGYKQDANLLARWAAKLAGCPKEAEYPFNSEWISVDKKDQRKRALLECLQTKWGSEGEAIDAFLEALGKVIDSAYAFQHDKKLEMTATMVPELLQTQFIQSLLPAPEQFFPSPCGETDEKAKMPETMEEPTTPEPPQEAEPAQEKVEDFGAADDFATANDHVDFMASIQEEGPAEQSLPPSTAAECVTSCRKCKKGRYVCLSGKAVGGCKKAPWGVTHSCSSSCHCA